MSPKPVVAILLGFLVAAVPLAAESFFEPVHADESVSSNPLK